MKDVRTGTNISRQCAPGDSLGPPEKNSPSLITMGKKTSNIDKLQSETPLQPVIVEENTLRDFKEETIEDQGIALGNHVRRIPFHDIPAPHMYERTLAMSAIKESNSIQWVYRPETADIHDYFVYGNKLQSIHEEDRTSCAIESFNHVSIADTAYEQFSKYTMKNEVKRRLGVMS